MTPYNLDKIILRFTDLPDMLYTASVLTSINRSYSLLLRLILCTNREMRTYSFYSLCLRKLRSIDYAVASETFNPNDYNLLLASGPYILFLNYRLYKNKVKGLHDLSKLFK